MALTKKAKLTFNTILEAAREHRLCLCECEDRKTGKKVSVICETWNENGQVVVNPMGKLFGGSPFNEVTPPGVSAPQADMTLEELQAKLDGLRAKRRDLDSEISLVTADIQRMCQHEWKWHQVAGEGRYCQLCNAVDYSED